MDVGNYANNVFLARRIYDAAREVIYWRSNDLSRSEPTPEFIWETRINELGKKTLYFPAMFVSDLHLGTNHSRAKRTSHMMENTSTDDLYAIGDIIDLTNWNELGKWSPQVLAHLFRKQAKFFAGNHEELPEAMAACAEQGLPYTKWLSQNLYGGRTVYDELDYKDPRGRFIHLTHGHPFDDIVFGNRKEMWYGIGDTLHNPLANFDAYAQEITGWDHFSTAATAKWLAKTVINGLGVKEEIIRRELKARPERQGFMYGHSHQGGIEIIGDQLLINTGHCTQHVIQGIAADRNGTLIFIDKWRKNRLDVTEENGSKYTFHLKDVSVNPPTFPPTFIEDDSLQLARCVLGNALRLAKPKNWQQVAQQLCSGNSSEVAEGIDVQQLPTGAIINQRSARLKSLFLRNRL